MYDFLSDEWIVAADEIRERYRDQVPDIGVAVRINLNLTDAPDSIEASHFWLDTSDGAMTLGVGELDEPDLIISSPYELAHSLLIDGAGERLMQSFFDGEVQLQGDMAKLMVLQATLTMNAEDETVAQAAEELRAITAPA